MGPDDPALGPGLVPRPAWRARSAADSPGDAAAPATVLIWRFSAAGDVVLTAPAVAALARAWPHARLVFVTKQGFAPLVQANPHLHAVVACGPSWSFWRLRRELVAWRAEAVCDLHGKGRGLLLRLTLPATRRAHWHKRDGDQNWTMRVGAGRYHARRHIVERYHGAVERLVGRLLPREPLRYYVAAADRISARRKLSAALSVAPAAAGATQPLIGMSPGAMWCTKRWPPARFMALANRLTAAGARIVLTGSPAERDINAALAAGIADCIDFTGRLTFGELGGAIATLQAFVANDSGPMHIARALGVPTLAFFGSTDPAQFDTTGHRVLFSGRDCAPCSFYGRAACPRGHLGCLDDLTVEAAMHAVMGLLRGGGPVPPVMG